MDMFAIELLWRAPSLVILIKDWPRYIQPILSRCLMNKAVLSHPLSWFISVYHLHQRVILMVFRPTKFVL